MDVKQNFHTHTLFCDGQNTPEEMVRAAIDKGMTDLGFSGHSYTSFDEVPCMSRKGTGEYIAEIAGLKSEYKDEINILCGVEQDFYSCADTSPYDFVIGSVHYLCPGKDIYISVDDTIEKLKKTIDDFYDSDPYAYAADYFDTVAEVVDETQCDFIGHFDLISKFNEIEKLFEETDPRYIASWQYAMDRLIATERPIEINTGAISRGYRTAPYPSESMLKRWRELGGEIIISSDAHSADAIDFAFGDAVELAKSVGYTKRICLTAGNGRIRKISLPI